MKNEMVSVLKVFGDLTGKLPHTLSNPRFVLSDKTQIEIDKVYYFIDQDYLSIYTPFSNSVRNHEFSTREISGYAMCTNKFYTLCDLPDYVNIEGENESGVLVTITGVMVNRKSFTFPYEFLVFSALKII
ncbi:MAG: hypothetical protein A2499_07210 [Stygiobacter sp. RIFOXYC12_FULL_38_8]|nr:MAG: hypothetical protein A2X62_05250 [Stygiobacter sp. GWC2_38_9]OGU84091.1 MAG: hypothetical protein A2279_09945 [Stygiobacter sp. RIFOXYA12_FULL_38_9]OGV09623.1 MAG: hypothetical protein A2299_00800 [Stygiobacter sp. RIFOXYB2_FULL_37_11]OGV16753.1 MAG: hypothetical protein A2440_05270 [Stygiobacter sp. RIFOXYC2_FULL_38_25]OGV18112.1 MAG: hypothetical protein A2237_06245 [Stygiobacter sp. RIFOXYA2_FULL_38_8]OGV25168.1 MAG: hypothetical protein A2499_07210 [Stygiobacter sp. RIFOXYC12_FULL_